MITVQKMWEDYRDNTMPSNAGARQVSEMKLAFFSGAFSILMHQVELAKNKTDEEALDLLHAWIAELINFGKNNAKERFR